MQKSRHGSLLERWKVWFLQAIAVLSLGTAGDQRLPVRLTARKQRG